MYLFINKNKANLYLIDSDVDKLMKCSWLNSIQQLNLCIFSYKTKKTIISQQRGLIYFVVKSGRSCVLLIQVSVIVQIFIAVNNVKQINESQNGGLAQFPLL